MKNYFWILKSLMIFCLGFSFLISCQKVSSSSQNCPKRDSVQKSLDAIQPGIKVETVKPSPVKGLCEVVVKLPNEEKGLFYIDPPGKHIITGSILEMKTLRNLTQEKLQDLNKKVLSKEQLSKLDKMVDFTYGNSKNVVYFITDPDCPHCKKAEDILNKLVKEGKLTVKVILLPIEALHPDAKSKAISLICDNKGFKELMEGYKNSSLCEKGKEKINQNISFLLNELKVRGTPTFIFPDGEMITNVLPESYILQKFK
jgi:thiol:disulfide interchange protein DsbC